MSLRKKISDRHAIFGDGHFVLKDDEVVQEGDQTGTLSTLLSISYHEGWRTVTEDFTGKTVRELCEEDGDMDGDERVFRRRR